MDKTQSVTRSTTSISSLVYSKRMRVVLRKRSPDEVSDSITLYFINSFCTNPLTDGHSVKRLGVNNPIAILGPVPFL